MAALFLLTTLLQITTSKVRFCCKLLQNCQQQSKYIFTYMRTFRYILLEVFPVGTHQTTPRRGANQRQTSLTSKVIRVLESRVSQVSWTRAAGETVTPFCTSGVDRQIGACGLDTKWGHQFLEQMLPTSAFLEGRFVTVLILGSKPCISTMSLPPSQADSLPCQYFPITTGWPLWLVHHRFVQS